MEPSKQELTLDESIKEVMGTLPPPIRQYLGHGKYLVVASRIMTKYGLHIDQGGVLEREIMLLLMGIDNPDEFTKVLATEAKIDAQTIGNIVKDVNEQIFMPLREEMRKGPAPRPVIASGGGSTPVQPRTVMSPQPSSPSPQALVPVPKYSPPKKYFNLQNKIPPAPTSKPIESNKLLGDHEEPHIDIRNKVQGSSPPVTESPLRQALRTVVPPENLPGAMPLPISAPLKPSNLPPTLVPKPEPIVPTVPVAPYSADPYRNL